MSGQVPSIERDKPHEDEMEQQNTFGEEPEKAAEDQEQEQEQASPEPEAMSRQHFDDMTRELMAIPDQMLAEERRYIAATRKIDALDKRAKEIESNIYTEVCDETDANDKKKFSNEKLRETETQRRLNMHKEMQQIREDRQTAQETQQNARTEYDYLKRKMKSFELIGMLARIKLKVD